VGPGLVRQLLARGHRVRVIKRTPIAGLEGAELMPGDASDRDFCMKAAESARTVYHCMNPPYDTKVWAVQVPLHLNHLIAAAGGAGARLVVMENVYMLGRPGGKPLDEDSPMNPCSRKGEIRARAAERLFDAHRRGEVEATAGRASDYYGPGGVSTYMGDFFWPAALAGKRAQVPCDPDAIHTYHYIPDVAAGLATLGTAEADVCGRPWMLPCAPAASLRDHATRFAKHLGRDIRVGAVPRWVMAPLGLFMPLARELAEMRYQWDETFVIDDRRFRERFGAAPTDAEEAARATVEWARARYGGPAASPR
jgi:nucleoside-diphosphate-sugar epimerase